jgi:hypothetical protein
MCRALPRERNPQGVGNRLLAPVEQPMRSAHSNAPVERRERLGGPLNFRHIVANSHSSSSRPGVNADWWDAIVAADERTCGPIGVRLEPLSGRGRAGGVGGSAPGPDPVAG